MRGATKIAAKRTAGVEGMTSSTLPHDLENDASDARHLAPAQSQARIRNYSSKIIPLPASKSDKNEEVASTSDYNSTEDEIASARQVAYITAKRRRRKISALGSASSSLQEDFPDFASDSGYLQSDELSQGHPPAPVSAISGAWLK